MRLLRSGGRGGGSAHREKLFGRDTETCGVYRWLRDNGFPGGIQELAPVLQRFRGHRRAAHSRAHRRQGALLYPWRDQAAGEEVRHWPNRPWRARSRC